MLFKLAQSSIHELIRINQSYVTFIYPLQYTNTIKIYNKNLGVVKLIIQIKSADNNKHPNGIEFANNNNNNLDNNFDYIKDYYKMNWFAGIIIECNDVIIDLNDHKLEMDNLFYLRNRFFTIISLTNKLFVDNNDITFTDNSKKNEFKSGNNCGTISHMELILSHWYKHKLIWVNK